MQDQGAGVGSSPKKDAVTVLETGKKDKDGISVQDAVNFLVVHGYTVIPPGESVEEPAVKEKDWDAINEAAVEEMIETGNWDEAMLKRLEGGNKNEQKLAKRAREAQIKGRGIPYKSVAGYSQPSMQGIIKAISGSLVR